MKFINTRFININLLLLVLIILAGSILRILNLNCPMGLWCDEMNSYIIAKQHIPEGIFNYLYERDFHLPLYYVFLHIWMNIFGDSDLTLRIPSLIFGILTIPIAYLTGKELSGPKLGLVIAAFFSINSGLIHYSQEVRFYSMLAFFAALSALFLIKIKNNPSKLNYIGLIISNLLIIYTFTIGFIFVFIELTLFFWYLNYSNANKKEFILSSLLTIILSCPLLPFLVHFAIKNYNNIFKYFDYYNFEWEYMFNLIKSIGGPLLPFYSVYWVKDTLIMNFFILLSTGIFLFFIIKAINKNAFVLILFLIGLLPFLIELGFSLLGEFAITYNKAILSIPFFIITAGCALNAFKNKKIFYILFFLYLLTNLSYLALNDNSVLFEKKGIGFYTIPKFLNKFNPTNKDALIILPYGGYMAAKYDYKAKVVPLILNDYSLNSKEALRPIFNEKFIESLNKNNVYYKLKDFVYSEKPTDHFRNFITYEVGNTIPKDRYIFVAVFIAIDDEELKYSKKHMMNAIWKKVTKDTLSILQKDKNFILIESKRYYGWTFYVFKRT